MDGGIASLLTEFAPEGVITVLGGGALWQVLRWRSKIESKLNRLQTLIESIGETLPDEQAAAAFRRMLRRGLERDNDNEG